MLAKSQSKLAGEIVEEGAWAHEVGSPEVGGLLLRLPLETQLAVARDSHWGRALRDFAGQERTRAAMEDARRRGVPASEAPAPEAVDLGEAALYRTAGRFLQLQLQRIAQKGQVDGSGRLAIDPRALTDADKALLDMHQKHVRRAGASFDESRRRRGRDVDIPWTRVAATPRPRRRHSVETSNTAAAT